MCVCFVVVDDFCLYNQIICGKNGTTILLICKILWDDEDWRETGNNDLNAGLLAGVCIPTITARWLKQFSLPALSFVAAPEKRTIHKATLAFLH